ncbi:MAG: Zn-dependent hydrolase [Rhodospirillales bacterium]|nr:Zn-dependent hydrolase [Rhodospirillales bacterium]
MTHNALIDRDRLWADIMALGAITDPARPYTRRSFSALFLEGREWLEQRFRDAGLSTHIDAAGNLVGRREGLDPNAGSIVIGSHSDSVPSGGRFDGMAGVIAGLEIARDLRDHRIELNHSLEVIDFLAEEPSEFGVSCVGSRGITGMLSPVHLALRNKRDEPLDMALIRMGGDPARLEDAVRNDIVAAFELHIEQGPVLEGNELDVGIVTSIVGITRIEVTFQGTAGHAGTTPMTLRRDPLIAAARLIGWIRDTAEAFAMRGQGHFVATTGIVEVLPNASNVIPKTARIVIDARSENRGLMEEFCRKLDTESGEAAEAANVDRVGLNRLSDSMPAGCDPALRGLLHDSAEALGLSCVEMASGAGHDMAFMSLVAPAAMIFIPCKGGRSHTPEEWASADAVAAGTEVVLNAILRLDGKQI